jgi:hypothetical protein
VLQAVLALDMSQNGQSHARALAPTVSRALLGLISACGEHITSPAAWDVLLALLVNTCSHPDAVLPVAAALDALCRESRGLSRENFMQTVTAVRAVVQNACAMIVEARRTRREGDLPFGIPEVRNTLDVFEQIAQWLQTWRQRRAQVRSSLPPATQFYTARSATTGAFSNSRMSRWPVTPQWPCMCPHHGCCMQLFKVR